jgi:hypothetical protein
MSTENKQADIREYQVRVSSTGTFGRLCNSRHHHFVVDGSAQNGCPGEALTPPRDISRRRSHLRRRTGTGVCEGQENTARINNWDYLCYARPEQSITVRRYPV